MRNQAIVMVGLPLDQILDKSTVQGSDMEFCPAALGGYKDDIIGFVYARSPSYQPIELVWDQNKIAELSNQFFNATNQQPKVWISPHIS